MTSSKVLKPNTLYLLFRTRDVTREPFGSHNTDVSVYISGPLHDQRYNDPWRGKAAWVNPVPHRGEHHHPNRTLSFHKVNLRHGSQSFFLWEIMPADMAVEERLQNMFIRKKHFDWKASKVCTRVLRNLHGDHHHENLLYEPIIPGHSRGVLRVINAAETGRPRLGNPILMPSNLTIMKVTPGEEIFKLIYDNAETITVMEPVGFLTQHPHVHHQPHHHRPKDYPSSRHRHHPNHHRGYQRRSLRQISSSASSRTSPKSRGLQYYYDPKRSRQTKYPIVATQHPIPAEAVPYPTNNQVEPSMYEPTAATVNYPEDAMRRASLLHPQTVVAPVQGAPLPVAYPTVTVEPTKSYVLQDLAVQPPSEAPAVAIPAPQYASQPTEASSRPSVSSRSSSRSTKRRPVPRRSSHYYYQPLRPRSRPSRSSYSSSRRPTSDSLYEDDSRNRHLGVRKTLSRLTDKLMARDGPPSLSGYSSSLRNSRDSNLSRASTDLTSDYGPADEERRAEKGKQDGLTVE
ncbi:hypothetical protein ACMFMG_002853 [Clarireedia jacksonii]